MTTSTMSSTRLWQAYLREMRFEFVKSLRTPAFAVPTMFFPIMFYMLFGVLLGSMRGNGAQSLYAFAVYGVFACMGPGLFGFGVALAMEREHGLLMLKQALPAPPGAYLLARAAMAMLFVSIIAIVLIILATTFGKVPLTLLQGLQLLAIDVIGTLPFCAIGMFIGSLVSGQASPAIVNLIFLPMAFLSGLLLPLQVMPKVLQDIAPAWPAFHLGQIALHTMGAPSRGTTATHVAVLATFTLVFFLLAVRRLQGGGFRLLGSRPGVVKIGVAVAAGLVLVLAFSGLFGGKSRQAEAAPAATGAASADNTAPADNSSVGIPAPNISVLANFDGGSDKAAYGEGWHAGGDDMRGGNSKATQRVIDGGAQDSKSSLEITGSIGDAIQYPFGGTVFFPDGYAKQAFMDYSGKQTLSFFTRGDGRQYTVIFLAGLAVDAIPAMYSFEAGPQWTEVRIPLQSLAALDLKRVHGIVIGSMGPTGDFRLQIDNVRLE